VTLIKQRNSGDCGVACLAMFMGVPYETSEYLVQEDLKRRTPVDGMNNVELAKILKSCGYEPMQVFTLLPNTPAILSVPAIGKNRKAFHYIYWNGEKIYDPSRFKTYSTKDFVNGFPMADSIICKRDLKVELPSHYFNHFDWEYIENN
jgi:ABC-type bacteriocin/lantibiotic exporter with double-glycine peptidase domain